MSRGNNAYVGFDVAIIRRKQPVELATHDRDFLCQYHGAFSIIVGEILIEIDKTLKVEE